MTSDSVSFIDNNILSDKTANKITDNDNDTDNNSIIINSVLCYIVNKRRKFGYHHNHHKDFVNNLNGDNESDNKNNGGCSGSDTDKNDKLKNVVEKYFAHSDIEEAHEILLKHLKYPVPVHNINGDSSNNEDDQGVMEYTNSINKIDNIDSSHDSGATTKFDAIVNLLNLSDKHGWSLPKFAAVDIDAFPEMVIMANQLIEEPSAVAPSTSTNQNCYHNNEILVHILKELNAVKSMVERYVVNANCPPLSTSPPYQDGASGHVTSPFSTADTPHSDSRSHHSSNSEGGRSSAAYEIGREAGRPARATPTPTNPPTTPLKRTAGRSLEDAVAKLKAIRTTTPENLQMSSDEEYQDEKGRQNDLLTRQAPPLLCYKPLVSATNGSTTNQFPVSSALFAATHQFPFIPPYSELMNAVLYSSSQMTAPPTSLPHSLIMTRPPPSSSSGGGVAGGNPSMDKTTHQQHHYHPYQQHHNLHHSNSDSANNSAPNEDGASGTGQGHAHRQNQNKLIVQKLMTKHNKHKASLSSNNNFDGGKTGDHIKKENDSAQESKRHTSKSFSHNDNGDDFVCKPYICQHANCNKRFANKFLLKKHEFIHTGERPHQCTYCCKRFNRKDNLLRHKKTHETSGNFVDHPKTMVRRRPRHSSSHDPVSANDSAISMGHNLSSADEQLLMELSHVIPTSLYSNSDKLSSASVADVLASVSKSQG